MEFLYFLSLQFLLLRLVPRASSDYASLSLSTDLTQQPGGNDTSYCAVYNPSYVSLPTGNRPSPTHFHRAFYPEATDPYGCTALPSDTSVNQSLLLDRGNCTFYRKALLAQRANGTMLVVVYNETILDTVPSLDPENSSDSDLPAITIPVLFVSNDTGKKLKMWLNSSPVYLSVYVPDSSVPIDPGAAILFCIAVGTVFLASLLANQPFQFLRYGLLLRKGMEHTTSKLDHQSNNMSVTSVLIGMTVMIIATCSLLVLLYFFYTPMVYIILALYSIASVFGLYNLLSPFVALIPLSDKYRLPRNNIPVLRYRPNPLFFVTVLFTLTVVVWWIVERHSDYAWILQDILGFAFIALLFSRLKFLKVWVVAVLMAFLFLYDIFMVFITPYFTNDGVSVMEKAATGPDEGKGSSELLPVVFIVPKILFPSTLEALCSEYIKSRPTSLLGYGDVGVPGLLVTLCLKFDLNYRKGNCLKIYYATSGIAYIIGLVATYIALIFMQRAQPALLYLVPTTLGSVLILSLLRREFSLFFTNKMHLRKHKDEPTSSDKQTSQRSITPDMMESEPEIGNENQVVHDEKRALIHSDDENKHL